MKRLLLKHKVNGAILTAFLLIVIIFSAIQLPFEQRRSKTVIDKVETIISTLIESNKGNLANALLLIPTLSHTSSPTQIYHPSSIDYYPKFNKTQKRHEAHTSHLSLS